jgi:hypothetical protein
MDFAYYLFIVALALLANIGKLEKAIGNIDLLKNPQENENNVYAHRVVMEMGEILSRPPTDRYPDMETNQAKVKLYYQRLKDSPVEIGNSEPVNNEKVKPILVSVK